MCTHDDRSTSRDGGGVDAKDEGMASQSVSASAEGSGSDWF